MINCIARGKRNKKNDQKYPSYSLFEISAYTSEFHFNLTFHFPTSNLYIYKSVDLGKERDEISQLQLDSTHFSLFSFLFYIPTSIKQDAQSND
jgi:hypothetical protein